jgi:hypothetical protein
VPSLGQKARTHGGNHFTCGVRVSLVALRAEKQGDRLDCGALASGRASTSILANTLAAPSHPNSEIERRRLVGTAGLGGKSLTSGLGISKRRLL